MPRLARIFLSDLQFDRFVRFLETTEEGRDRLARLEIDRPMLDLDDDVVVELPVERMKIVVRGLARSFFEIAPVEMMVVDERAIENDAAVRLESVRDDVARVGRRTMIRRRTEPPFGVGLDDYAAEGREWLRRLDRRDRATISRRLDRADRMCRGRRSMSGC